MTPVRLLGLTAILCASIASAQPAFQPPVISQIQGRVYLAEEPLLEPGRPLNGAVVRTADASRVEIRLRGALLYVGEKSLVRVWDNQPDNFSRLEVLGGSAVLVTGTDGSALAVCEDTVNLSKAGIFRFDFRTLPASPYGENECQLRVSQGAARVQLSTLTVALTNGKTMQLNRRCGDMIPTQPFHTEDLDDLDRWSREGAAIAAQRQ